MKAWINKIKLHIPSILIIIGLVLIVFSTYLFFEWDKLYFGDMYSYRYRMEITKISIEKYHDFIPLWSPYTMSGAPFYAKLGADYGFFYINYPLLMLLPITSALKLSYIIPIILAGIFMYFLMIYLKLEKRYALLSAILYMFNGWLYSRFSRGHLGTISPYSITPLIILYTIKIFKEKEWIKNSIITGILFAIQIHGGPDLKVTLWVLPIVGLYIMFSLIGSLSLKRIKRIAYGGVIIMLVTFALVAIKVLPALDYLELGSRVKLDLQTARHQRATWSFSNFIEPIPPKIYSSETHYNIGIIAFLLAGFAIFKKHKNKIVLYFLTVAVIAVFLGTGSFLFYLFWKYVPYYSSFRYPERILSIYVFPMAALAGIGASLLDKEAKDRFKWSPKKIKFAYIILIILILINNVVFGISPYRKYPNIWINPDDALEDNHILQHLAKQPGIFRIHVYETMGIDWGTEFQNIPLGLQNLYGYDAAWLVDYMNVYLSIALQQPAKFWGILNTKYVTSQKELNITGLKFIKKFENCTICFINMEQLKKIGGPYLYENEKFIPRAYIVNNSILVVGKEENVMRIIYGLMLNEQFNPSNTVIIRGKESINDYSLGELRRYSAIFLTPESIDQSSIFILKNYVENKGKLFPDITKNEQTISNEKIGEMFASFKGSLNEINDNEHIFINFDKRRLKLNGKSGFLVYSEILTHYPGWKALADGKRKDISRADGVIGAIYLDTPTEEVILEFKPKSFTTGSIITLTAIILIIVFFILRSKYMNSKHTNKKPLNATNTTHPQITNS